MPRLAARVLVAVALSATLLGACGGGDGRADRDSTSTSTTRRSTAASTSTTVDGTSGTTIATSLEEGLTARYLGFWQARFDANQHPPDPDFPALREFATGEQLENVVSETRHRLDEGLALRAPDPSVASHDIRVISIDGDQAEVQDCFVNDGVLYDAATGEAVDSSVVTRSVSGVMVREGGVWKLARATVIQEWEGVAGCALAEQ
jgi:hypothetical protein